MYVCACVHMCVLVSTFYWSEWHIKTLLPFIFHSILFIYTFPPPTFRTHQTASFSTIKNTLEHSRREGWHIICSVSQSCLTLCNSMDCSTPGFSVHHQLPLKLMSTESVMPPNHLILCHPPSPSAFNLSQHQSLFQSVGSSHQVGKVSIFQLQHQSFQWIFRTDFL